MIGEIADLHQDPRSEVKVTIKTDTREMDFVGATALVVVIPEVEPTVVFKTGPHPLSGQSLLTGNTTGKRLQTLTACALSNLWVAAGPELVLAIVELGGHDHLFARALLASIRAVQEPRG